MIELVVKMYKVHTVRQYCLLLRSIFYHVLNHSLDIQRVLQKTIQASSLKTCQCCLKSDMPLAPLPFFGPCGALRYLIFCSLFKMYSTVVSLTAVRGINQKKEALHQNKCIPV